jgi:hypothetical protein
MSINNNKQSNYINNYYLNDTNSTLSSSSSSSLSTSSSSSSLLLTPNNKNERQQQTVENNRNDLFENDEEFQSILKHYKNNNKINNINDATLIYLYKLLKFFKLDHYMIDLIENGYTTPIQLNNINDEFESIVNVSPYDKKKFFKLKLFIKQIIKSIQLKSKSSNKTNNNNNNNNTLNDKINDYLVNNDNYDNFVDPNLNNLKDTNKFNNIKNYSSTTNKMLKKDLVFVNTNMKNNDNNKKQQQMFTKNPNINQSRAKRIVMPPNSARPTMTSSAKANKNGPYTPRSAASSTNNYTIYKSNNNKQSRAKSTEPLSLNHSNKSTAISAKSITNLDQLVTPDSKISATAVQHPIKYSKLISTNNTNTNKFFGPKLQQFIDNQKNISNVKLIETNNYNYGVPLQQQIKYGKKMNYLYNKKCYFNLANQQTSKSKLVTNDIYVYARKRPILQSESNFSDVVVIGNESGNNENNEITKNICVNELKSSVDGTPILRKVNNVFYNIFFTNL